MFKSIKEFFVGKPKVEEAPAEVPYKVEAAPEPVPAPVPLGTEATIVASAPIVEEIKPETVFISASDNMNISISTQSDTITLTPPVVDNTVWPFPKAVPAEEPVSKTRTPVKQKEAVTTKKTTPAITANSKSRKKK
jgi:hypothetical protein